MAYVGTLLLGLLGSGLAIGNCLLVNKVKVRKWPLIGKLYTNYGCYTSSLLPIIIMTIIFGFAAI